MPESDQAKSRAPASQNRLGSAQPPRVLVTDDYEDNAQSMAMLLRLHGYETDVALNGPAALALSESHEPDAALLDISMPGMSGYEVARALRAKFDDHILLIAVTARDGEEDRRRCKEAGFDVFLTKPADPSCVLDLLCSNAGCASGSTSTGSHKENATGRDREPVAGQLGIARAAVQAPAAE